MSLMQNIGVQSPLAMLAITRWGELKTERARHEADWQLIAQLFRPLRKGMGMDDPANALRAIRPLSSDQIKALQNFAAGLYGTLTNPTQRWFGFTVPDRDLADWQANRAWLDTVTERVLASFASGTFYDASLQVYSDLAAFGNAPTYDEVIPGRGIIDVALNLAEVCADIDAHGQVVEVVRRYHLTAEQAVARFGAQAVPPKMLDMAEKGRRDRLAFYHHVMPNEAWRPGALGPKGKRWVSRHVTEVEHAMLAQGGYDEMPFYMPRWDVGAGEVYGIGLAGDALPAAQALARMDDATLRAAQMAADPPILAPDRGAFTYNGHIRPGAVVYEGVNMQGNPMLRPLDVSGNIGLTLQDRQAKAEEIRNAFHYQLMSLSGRSGISTLEVATINEERLRLWAPYMGRVQGEYLARKVQRRFSLLWRAGQLPPPPPDLEGQELTVTYESAAAQAQRAAEGNAILRVVQDIAPLIQMEPRFMDRLNPDTMLEVLAETRGAPARVLRSREEADALAQARAEAQQAAAMMQAGQAGAGMMKDLAQAGMMGGAQ